MKIENICINVNLKKIERQLLSLKLNFYQYYPIPFFIHNAHVLKRKSTNRLNYYLKFVQIKIYYTCTVSNIQYLLVFNI